MQNMGLFLVFLRIGFVLSYEMENPPTKTWSFCFVGGKWLFGGASGECACLRAGLDYLLRVTVYNTFPFLSIMRSSSVFLLADTMEKPGSGLQNTVPFDGLHLAGERKPAELVI